MLIVIMLRQRLDRLPRQPQARMHEQPVCQSAAILEERLNTPTGVPYVCLSDFHEPLFLCLLCAACMDNRRAQNPTKNN